MTLYLASHFGFALVLALIALALTRYGRRELAHVAWLLVLVKLLVPPLFEVPVFAPVPELAPSAPIAIPVGELVSEPLSVDFPATSFAPSESPGIPATTWLVSIWIAGAAAMLALAMATLVRLRRLLARAKVPSAELAGEVKEAAAALGLARAPRVRVVDARISPALWPARSATLVLPCELMSRLSREERRHVLLHELVHFQRKDHWVRALEALALVVYWWLPPVYWVRSRLRDSEESCCDARVLRVGGSGRDYASALIRTVEFLQGGSDPRPALTTGVLTGNSLDRRITMIMLAGPQRPLRLAWRIAFAASMLALVPLLPVRARSAPESSDLPGTTGTTGTTDVSGDTTAAAYESPKLVPPAVSGSGDEPELDANEAAAVEELFALLEAGDTGAVKERLKALRNPDANAVFDFLAGNLAVQEGRLAEAERDFGIAVVKHPTFTRAWGNLGTLRMRMGMHAEAAYALRSTIALGTADATLYGLLGTCLAQSEDLAGAEAAYWMAIRLDPQAREWCLGLISTLFKQSRPGDAVSVIEELLAQQPDDTRVLSLYGEALLALGRADQAGEVLARIESLGAATAESRYRQAELDLNRGRYAAGVEAFRRVLAEDPEADTQRVIRAARFLTASGETEFAKELLAMVDQVLPQAEPSILIALTKGGKVVYADREIGFDGVRPLVERLLGGEPGVVRVGDELVEYTVAGGNARELPVVIQVDQEAESGWLVRIVDEAKAAGASRVSIATRPSEEPGPRTELLRQQARTDPALFELLLQLDPLDGEALILLGKERAKKGEYETPLALFARAAELAEFEAQAFLNTAQVLAKMQRYDDAVRAVRRSLDLEPSRRVAEYLEALEAAVENLRVKHEAKGGDRKPVPPPSEEPEAEPPHAPKAWAEFVGLGVRGRAERDE